LRRRASEADSERGGQKMLARPFPRGLWNARKGLQPHSSGKCRLVAGGGTRPGGRVLTARSAPITMPRPRSSNHHLFGPLPGTAHTSFTLESCLGIGISVDETPRVPSPRHQHPMVARQRRIPPPTSESGERSCKTAQRSQRYASLRRTERVRATRRPVVETASPTAPRRNSHRWKGPCTPTSPHRSEYELSDAQDDGRGRHCEIADRLWDG
jgi:hypothetical protein